MLVTIGSEDLCQKPLIFVRIRKSTCCGLYFMMCRPYFQSMVSLIKPALLIALIVNKYIDLMTVWDVMFRNMWCEYFSLNSIQGYLAEIRCAVLYNQEMFGSSKLCLKASKISPNLKTPVTSLSAFFTMSG